MLLAFCGEISHAALKYIEGWIYLSSVKLLPAGLAHVLSKNLPISQHYASIIRLYTYYAQNYAGILASCLTVRKSFCV